MTPSIPNILFGALGVVCLIVLGIGVVMAALFPAARDRLPPPGRPPHRAPSPQTEPGGGKFPGEGQGCATCGDSKLCWRREAHGYVDLCCEWRERKNAR